MRTYMRDQFPFLGVTAPQRTAVLRDYLAAYGPPPPDDLEALTRALWAMPEREFQYTAVDLLKRQKKQLTPDHLPALQHAILSKSWWDTIDTLAAHPVAAVFARYPEARAATVAVWRADPGIWLRRTTLLFQLLYKDKTDAALLFSLIEDNLNDGEFFIQKAIGWALRQYSKTDQTAVTDFVAATPLSPLAEREGLKWLRNQNRL